jgi:pyruvate/2-oxoglutarate dehydrogenase complex dihydrolipoamide acyltransferase (E2) component
MVVEAAAPPSSTSKRRSTPAPAHEKGDDNGSVRAGRTSPVVRKLALEHGVNLEQVEGSGSRGRVTREDVMRAAETQKVEPPKPATAAAASREEKKARDAARARLEKKLATLEDKIAATEAELAAVRDKLAASHGGDWQKLHALVEDERRLSERLRSLEGEWEKTGEELAG